MKVVDKKFLESENKADKVITEKEIMAQIENPFIVRLRWAFQSSKKLHFVMDFCAGGELFYHLRTVGRLSESQAKFYFAEVLVAIAYLHSRGIMYRDLKPENVLLDIDGHVRLADFGLSKEGMRLTKLTDSFCGSPEYMSPEMLEQTGHTLMVDYYSLGALVYEMVFGLPPYYATDHEVMYSRILTEKLVIPTSISASLRHLLTLLLEKDQFKRLGSKRGIEEIKAHPWCRDIDWEAYSSKKVKPPFKPSLQQSHFDPEYVEDVSRLKLERSNSCNSFNPQADSEMYKDFLFERKSIHDATKRVRKLSSKSDKENCISSDSEGIPKVEVVKVSTDMQEMIGAKEMAATVVASRPLKEEMVRSVVNSPTELALTSKRTNSARKANLVHRNANQMTYFRKKATIHLQPKKPADKKLISKLLKGKAGKPSIAQCQSSLTKGVGLKSVKGFATMEANEYSVNKSPKVFVGGGGKEGEDCVKKLKSKIKILNKKKPHLKLSRNAQLDSKLSAVKSDGIKNCTVRNLAKRIYSPQSVYKQAPSSKEDKDMADLEDIRRSNFSCNEEYYKKEKVTSPCKQNPKKLHRENSLHLSNNSKAKKGLGLYKSSRGVKEILLGRPKSKEQQAEVILS
eukprot:TRINITY_DN10269_c0_g5_i1.p1 TRINITY_DN10269_c0_g5~~TRINITY_DN10269_c0_g5_i1.p1  ORF type:complete len:625 (-),score=164.67 TRINITY_DN10269_c0_g5_i1:62-1936(-)